MLIAELRRKLSDLEDIDPGDPGAVEHIRDLLRDTQEDLLTADLFGAVKYLPRTVYLRAVLEGSVGSTAREARAAISRLTDADLEEATFHFWPRLFTPAGLPPGVTEPDLLISMRSLVVLVECKLHAGFGAQQIEREIAAGAMTADGRDMVLLLVTRSCRPPRLRTDIGRLPLPEYLKHVLSDGSIGEPAATAIRRHREHVLCTSWDRIATILRAAYAAHPEAQGGGTRVGDILEDLQELMAMRGLHPFTGVPAAVGDSTLIPSRPIFFAPGDRTRRLRFLSLVEQEVPDARPVFFHSRATQASLRLSSLVDSAVESIPWRFSRAARSRFDPFARSSELGSQVEEPSRLAHFWKSFDQDPLQQVPRWKIRRESQ